MSADPTLGDLAAAGIVIKSRPVTKRRRPLLHHVARRGLALAVLRRNATRWPGRTVIDVDYVVVEEVTL